MGSGLLKNDMVNSQKKEWQSQEESMVIIVICSSCHYSRSERQYFHSHPPHLQR
jgi:hypothetical protein